MKKFFKNRYVCLTLSILAAICGGILFYYVVFNSTNLSTNYKKIIKILMPIIDGFVLAYLLSPAVNYIENHLVIPIAVKIKGNSRTPKRKRFIRSVSILITMSLFFAGIYVFLLMVIPQIVLSVRTVAFNFPTYEHNLEVWLSDILKNNPDIEAMVEECTNTYMGDFQEYLTGDVLPWANTILKALSSKVLSAFVLFLNFIIGIIISIYLLSSKELYAAQCKKLVYAFFDEKIANKIIDEFRFVHKTFGGFIIGKIVDSVIIGMLCFIGCTILNMPYAELISVIIGITNVIPFFGPFIGAIPSALLVLMVDPIKCIYFIIFILVLQQVDGNIIGPKILGQSTGLSGFWVIFAITFFGGFFGFVGMFVGVPVFAVFYSFIKRWCSRLLHAKGMPVSTNAYMLVKNVKNGALQIADDPSALEEDVDEPVKIVIKAHREDTTANEDMNTAAENEKQIDNQTTNND